MQNCNSGPCSLSVVLLLFSLDVQVFSHILTNNSFHSVVYTWDCFVCGCLQSEESLTTVARYCFPDATSWRPVTIYNTWVVTDQTMNSVGVFWSFSPPESKECVTSCLPVQSNVNMQRYECVVLYEANGLQEHRFWDASLSSSSPVSKETGDALEPGGTWSPRWGGVFSIALMWAESLFESCIHLCDNHNWLLRVSCKFD